MTAAEKRVALRLASLHPADQAWVLGRLDPTVAHRIRVLMGEPLVARAIAAGIDATAAMPFERVAKASELAPSAPAPVRQAAPFTDSWAPEWVALLDAPERMPPALAASLARFAADATPVEAA